MARFSALPSLSPRTDTRREGRLNGDDETRKLARLSVEAPRVPWDVYTRDILRWKAGEHFGLIGPTGQGKTTMLHNLLPLHPYVVVFATKPRDESMTALASHGYHTMKKWQPGLTVDNYPRRILWPDARKLHSETHQREVFADAFGRIYREGYWTVALDELTYMTQNLRLEKEVKTYLMQARSLGISLLAATQRPANIPLEVYDQSTHLMFWRDNDEANLKRMSGISWRSSNMIRGIISELDRFQVLYVNTRTGQMVRTRCPSIYPTS